ncbi:asparagine synthetase B family protein [Salisaeta longa]|uniref:hypothetical protein n=1 Tax=Salisaeta longa TaxID=503170 RepID=UPI0003B4494F|nr:hypothetical protein [Salisaeta longa]
MTAPSLDPLRRRFILGPRLHPAFNDATHVRLRTGGLVLQAHPDLDVTHDTNDAGVSATLLGFALDPRTPRATNADVLNRLLQETTCAADAHRVTHFWGGRWVLVVEDASGARLFADPCGFRQAFYTDAAHNERWCATHPGLLSDVMPLTEAPNAREGFIETGAYQNRPEWVWPYDTALYQGVRRLLPNHFLDLTTGHAHRFWPTTPRREAPLVDVVTAVAPLLRGLMEGMAHRAPLAVAVTAGLDSRLVLAAARSVADRAWFHTQQYWAHTARTPDMYLPPRLCAHLGLAHHIVDCPADMTPAFAAQYHAHTHDAHPAYGVIAEGLHRHLPAGHVLVKGNGAEIARGRQVKVERPSIEDLARITVHASHHPFTEHHTARWLKEVRPVAARTGYAIPSLHYWEHRMGSWQAQAQTEWDLVCESFTPFNCRAVLVHLLATPVPVQEETQGHFYRLIDTLWPEALALPVNPTPLREKIRATLRTVWRRVRA